MSESASPSGVRDSYRPPDMPVDAWAELVAAGVPRRLGAGQLICSPGDACKGWPLVLEGGIRLYTMSAAGREMTLYRLGPGDSCFLTVSCLLGEQSFPVFAVADGETELEMLDPMTFRRWFDESPEFRRHVCGTLTGRLIDVIATVQEVAFRRIDARLAAFLVQRADDDCVSGTHAEIAADLGTSREVVSRILKEFERDGWLELRRGKIELRDREALARVGGTFA